MPQKHQNIVDNLLFCAILLCVNKTINGGESMTQTRDFYHDYMPAYLVSNENQRRITRAIPASRVLTVTGSGDQALFYKLAGAQVIHTYDITLNAKIIQDIKVAAIKTLEYSEYTTLLDKLYYTDKITLIPEMQKPIHALPQKTRNMIYEHQSKYMFSAGLNASQYPEYQLNANEYETLHNTIQKSFNFNKCPLDKLSTKIFQEYDLINTSNIFDTCYTSREQAHIFYDLLPHLTKGGRIIYLSQSQRFNYKNVKIANGDKLLQYEKTIQCGKTEMILFQRTR